MADRKMVTLTIDGREVTVPEGTLIVDAAKELEIDIPVFCYHPKMEPVGMCRMCLVEIGRPQVDRATGEFVKDETGKPKIAFGPKMETACTTPVSQGMVVNGMTEPVQEARKDIIEFLLTSHPLDCPICDKGGECPLQNLTMAHGPGQSRFLYNEKMRLAKHYPLGDLIFLDRERCIQCARCIRFQDEIVDDPVIGFYNRGRSLEIITYSDPGFDSYFSGNTTDICPVGALTWADFRFRARPWEMNLSASICTQCPVGCNLSVNVRREARSGGDTVVKRIMPRQNEEVNEIWICDKGRLGYHYAQNENRLDQPLIREDGKLTPTTWEVALQKVAEQMRFAGSKLVTLVGDHLSNEDLFVLKQLTDAQGGKALLHTVIGGGDVVSQYGLPAGSNIKDMGPGTVILVIASDLEEEAPIWWLRIKQAAERGATLIVANPRLTKLDKAAAYRLRYSYGQEVATLEAFLSSAGTIAEGDLAAAVQAFANAENTVILYGQEGMDITTSQALAVTAARVLQATGRVGKPNNGLMAAWSGGNTQGAWEIGFRPVADLVSALAPAGLAYIVGADPVSDDPTIGQALQQNANFVVVQELYLTPTAEMADVVLPAQSFLERDGTYVSGERRAQRFYPAVPARGMPRADYEITGAIAQRLGHSIESRSALLVFQQLAQAVPAFGGLSYTRLVEVVEQYPKIGRHDLYYGGTSYDNYQGLGHHLALVPAGELPAFQPTRLPVPADGETDSLPVVPVTRLYDQGRLIASAEILRDRLTGPMVGLHPADAERLGLADGAAQATFNGVTQTVHVVVDAGLPQGVAIVPRSVGLPILAPGLIQLNKAGVPA